MAEELGRATKDSGSGHYTALKRIAEAKQSHAEELDLGGLGLTEIPMELTELPWLKRLFLGLDKEAREKDFASGKRLKHNALTDLPPKLFHCLPKLELLDLSNNKLSALPPEIGVLTALQTLDLS